MPRLRAATDTPLRAVIYLRQSHYREESISLELQERACRDYCDRLGYDVVAVEADPGISGRTWNRPAVQRVMTAIEKRDADVVVLWKWSRLSRSRKDWALALDRADIAGGRIESATEPIDTATASGRFARGVMTEYAAFQSEQIGEQWEEVRQRRLGLGLPASGRLPYGWNWTDAGIEPDPEQASVVVDMYARYLRGSGSAEIARWLNQRSIPGPNGTPWTRARPLTVMDSPIHAGLIPYRGETYPGAHAPIIDDTTRAAYLRERARRRRESEKPRTGAYLLSLLMVCSCGSRMAGKGAVTGGRWYGGYLCGAKSTAVDHAGAAYISALRIEPAIEEWALSFEITGTYAGGSRAADTARHDRLLRQLSQLEDEAAQVLRDRGRGDAPPATYDRALAMIDQDRAKLSADIAAAAQALAVAPDLDAMYQLRADWEFWPTVERNRALRSLIGRIELAADGSAATIYTAWGASSVVRW